MHTRCTGLVASRKVRVLLETKQARVFTTPGVHPEDGDGKPWTCSLLTKFSHAPLTRSQATALSLAPEEPSASEECAKEGGDCTLSRCCAGSSLHCYEKSKYYAKCRFSCDAGLDPKDK